MQIHKFMLLVVRDKLGSGEGGSDLSPTFSSHSPELVIISHLIDYPTFIINYHELSGKFRCD